MIHSVHNEARINCVIQILKEMDIDGETMQYILEQVGMNDQMLRQLIMSNPESDVKDLLNEKIELNNNSVIGRI
jgi:hypothetical protein